MSLAYDPKNKHKYPTDGDHALILQFMLPEIPPEILSPPGAYKIRRNFYDVRFFIDIHNDEHILSLHYDREEEYETGENWLIVESFYIEQLGRVYRLYLHTPKEERPYYIVEISYVPLVYCADTSSRQYLLKFVEHNTSDKIQ